MVAHQAVLILMWGSCFVFKVLFLHLFVWLKRPYTLTVPGNSTPKALILYRVYSHNSGPWLLILVVSSPGKYLRIGIEYTVISRLQGKPF